jgi:hypothetical protein
MICSKCKKNKEHEKFIRNEKQYKTCNTCFKSCEEEGCTSSARGKTNFCKRHGGGKRCEEEGCTSSAIGKTNFCITHGGGKRCEEEGCTSSAIGKTNFCITHGGGKRCEEEGCTSSAKGKTNFCITHGGGKRCEEEGCTSSAQGKTNFCITHGGGLRCPNCIEWIDSRSGCLKYDGFCATCFKQIFPEDPRSVIIYQKSAENKVRNFLNENYEGFIHDRPLYSGNCDCTHRRRIDHRKLIGGTILAIETDERQHRSYNKEDEEIRYDDLYMVHSGGWIFIRINPDSYKNKKNKRMNPMLNKRMIVLKQVIDEQIRIIENGENGELVKIIKLYYDGY